MGGCTTTTKIKLNHFTLDGEESWIEKFPKHSAISFSNELTHAGYKDMPVSCLVCEEDLCIPVDVQDREIEMIERESGMKVDVTRIRADHCPNITSTHATTDWIVSVPKSAGNRGVKTLLMLDKETFEITPCMETKGFFPLPFQLALGSRSYN